ncbi:ADP-ribose pyrophosphatase YjhB, NUDIX family [Actinokineospora alba]|uniref:ADP-ribose pyrophosphatase YjhB, NUDIX family n=1 Tax=Actinokineospora alba TaxID=504798 RepID=A0A1H0W216_9PSEU|nr:NUDIX hydrolase [Actinokineospora alba]TDP67784.1 ADP-ribose pyrophosphatase YjhB (NUDIX family) [Actinokineospora alba]SDI71804.1 ADP-ribose pyrophosphatase YjhB, NUDIX family [Actinokineospora alba]SDP84744.1 ADP-ribose pyrophosphatase YjhB, NUDIX family [Actinokineospora alba]
MSEVEDPWQPGRSAVRVVCVDGQGRVLLLKWRGPEADYWEPPGGGVDPGESPEAGARREFHEETGLPGSAVTDTVVEVRRDFAWFGKPAPRVELFYLARVEEAQAAAPVTLSAWEVGKYVESQWFTVADLADVDAHVEPPDLPEILRTLTS